MEDKNLTPLPEEPAPQVTGDTLFFTPAEDLTVTPEEAAPAPAEAEAAPVEEAPVMEEAPIVEEAPVMEDTPVTEDVPAEELVSLWEDAPVMEEAPIMEEVPMMTSFFSAPDEFTGGDTAPVNIEETMVFSAPQEEPPLIYQPPVQESFPAVEGDFLETEEDQQAFAAMFGEDVPAAPAAEPVAEEAPAPKVRKGRPKRKKGDGLFGLPHLAATLIWLMLIVAIGITLGKAVWICAADVLAFGRESSIVTVEIVAGDNIDTIAAKLKDAGLINYPGLFKIYAQLTGAEEEISTGTFSLNTNYDYHALVNGLSPSSSNRETVEILIPEGYNSRQIYQLLEDNNVCSVEELEAYAADGEFADFWFLQDVPRGDKYCLEGYLFPDTYEFYVNSTPREALGKMLMGFDNRFTQEMQDQLPALNERLSAMMRENGCSEDYIAAHQLTIRDVLIVASLIEEETSGAGESPNIASVIYNRLTQDMEYERYLGIDAALIYATGSTTVDTSLDSPYNTYTNAGLPPTPISNPGLASINAALDPADTGYYYYVLNPETGSHQFSKTYEEHQQWIEKFREDE